MIKIENAGSGVYVLRFQNGENRFSPEFLEGVNKALDEVEGEARALVTTGEDKFYSNGLDLDWLNAHGQQSNWYVGEIHALYARFLKQNLPSVAAVNGHAFAGGGMLALSHDFAVMREDRGWFCLPEVDINIPFTPGMAALVQAKLSTETAHEVMLTGRRYTGPEAVEAGIVRRTASEGEVVGAAIELAAALAGKDGRTFGAIRRTMYRPAIQALSAEPTLRLP
ncbi:enoyl-CoA hydratase/isomerase family protein [Actinocorallia sp. B10E7]|uniref:enoyl-CoA hydratase/isomerase family protein n=1 Tax=Actinocorallia sp. B10E7 TaxID=3153558 RepID=UPI00325E7798